MMLSTSLSKYHKEHPWGMDVHGQRHEVNYWPGDSQSGMFGGNSNWRGPIWLAVNFLLIESLQRFHQFYGDEIEVSEGDTPLRIWNLTSPVDRWSVRLGAEIT